MCSPAGPCTIAPHSPSSTGGTSLRLWLLLPETGQSRSGRRRDQPGLHEGAGELAHLAHGEHPGLALFDCSPCGRGQLPAKRSDVELELAADLPSPDRLDEIALTEIDLAALFQALDVLTPDQRQVVELRLAGFDRTRNPAGARPEPLVGGYDPIPGDPEVARGDGAGKGGLQCPLTSGSFTGGSIRRSTRSGTRSSSDRRQSQFGRKRSTRNPRGRSAGCTRSRRSRRRLLSSRSGSSRS